MLRSENPQSRSGHPESLFALLPKQSSRRGGARAVDLPAWSFDLARPGVAPPLIKTGKKGKGFDEKIIIGVKQERKKHLSKLLGIVVTAFTHVLDKTELKLANSRLGSGE